MFKKTIVLFLVLICACFVRPGLADEYGDFEYIMDIDGLTITKCLTDTQTVSIPSTIDGFDVVGIGERVFSDCFNITNVIIPSSVTNISERAFDDCQVNNISVNSSNPNYSSSDGVLFNKNKTTLIRFPETKRTQNYTIPTSVKRLEDRSFRNTRAGNMKIPTNVVEIGMYAFGMSSLGDITLHDSITCIEPLAFADTPLSWESTYWENGMMYIGNYLVGLDYNKTPTDLIVKDGTTIISVAWEGYETYESLTIPESVRYIASVGQCEILSLNYNAIDCKAIDYLPLEYTSNLTIGEKVKAIPENAFREYGNYVNSDEEIILTIPQGIEKIGNKAFYGSGITQLIYNAKNCTVSADNEIFGFDLDSIIIGSDVKKIPSYMFEHCCFTEITIPQNVTEIGKYAFYGSSLVNATLPDSISKIGEGAFEYTPIYQDKSKYANNVLYIGNHLINALPELSGAYSINESTITISPYAFENCNKLTEITLGKNIKHIGKSAFKGCSSLETINYNAIDCNIEPDYRSFNYSTIIYGPFADSITNLYYTIKINIGSSVTKIPAGAFSRVPVTDITIPNSVTEIGDCAFAGCYKLENVQIPSAITRIGNKAFFSTALDNISLPDKAISIGYGAFEGTNYYDNTSNWENGLLYIGKHLVNFKSPSTAYQTFVIKDGTLTIADWTFLFNQEGIEYIIPKSVVLIGSKVFYEDNAFPLKYMGSMEDWAKISIADDAFGENVTVQYNYVPHITIYSKAMHDTYFYCKLNVGYGLGKSSAIAILAFYDENGMISAWPTPINLTEGTYETTFTINFDKTDYKTYKIFIWEDMDCLTPLMKSSSYQ